MMIEKVASIIDALPNNLSLYISQKIVNYILNKYADIEICGEENIKNEEGKGILFVCNHLSNSDGLVLNVLLKKYDVAFIAGEKLYSDKFTKLGAKTVQTINIKPNSADMEAIKSVIKRLKGGKSVLLFPEGTRSRTGGLIQPKKGVSLFVRMSNATIIPIGLSGTNILMPVNKEGNMSKESFSKAKIKINIGKSYKIDKKEENMTKEEYEESIVNKIMESIAEILPEENKGIYK